MFLFKYLNTYDVYTRLIIFKIGAFNVKVIAYDYADLSKKIGNH